MPLFSMVLIKVLQIIWYRISRFFMLLIHNKLFFLLTSETETENNWNQVGLKPMSLTSQVSVLTI